MKLNKEQIEAIITGELSLEEVSREQQWMVIATRVYLVTDVGTATTPVPFPLRGYDPVTSGVLKKDKDSKSFVFYVNAMIFEGTDTEINDEFVDTSGVVLREAMKRRFDQVYFLVGLYNMTKDKWDGQRYQTSADFRKHFNADDYGKWEKFWIATHGLKKGGAVKNGLLRRLGVV